MMPIQVSSLQTHLSDIHLYKVLKKNKITSFEIFVVVVVAMIMMATTHFIRQLVNK